MTDRYGRADERGRVHGARLLRLYPRAWRERYEEEFLAVLGSRAVGRRGRLDIVRGALDAHLHPWTPSLAPGAVALLGGGLWILGTASILALPVPLDWPGYLVEALPMASVAVAALTVAVSGAWLRLDGRSDRVGRRLGTIGLSVALVGHAAWLGLLVGAVAGIGYGAPLAVASTAAGIGTIFIGIALARAGDWPIAGLLVATPVLLVLPPQIVPSAWAWIAFGVAWLLIGIVQLDSATRPVGPVGPVGPTAG